MRLINADKLRHELIMGHDLVGAKYTDMADTVEAIPIEFIEEYISYQDTEEQRVLRMMWHAWELVEKKNETN